MPFNHGSMFVISAIFATTVLAAVGVGAACTGSKQDSSGEKTAHNFSSWETISEPTCYAEGTQGRTCLDCGLVEELPIGKKQHTIQYDAEISPTCSTAGMTSGSHCSVCGEVIVEQTALSALNHQYYTNNTGITYCVSCGKEQTQIELEKGLSPSFDQKNLLSVVSIVAKFDKGQTTDQAHTHNDGQRASGVVYKLDKEKGIAYIVSNYHEVYHKDAVTADKTPEDIKIYFYGMEYFGSAENAEYPDYGIPCEIYGYSKTNDLVILKTEPSDLIKSGNVLPVEFGDSDSVCVGDPVYTVGNSCGYGLTTCEGIISMECDTISLELNGMGTLNLRCIRTSATINNGNSGGALFDVNGKLIGIPNAKEIAYGVEGMGYALPINKVRSVVENIFFEKENNDNPMAYKAFLGINVFISSSGTVYDEASGTVRIMEETKIDSVNEGGASYNKLQAGDVIKSLKINDVCYDVHREYVLLDALYDVRVNDIVTITVLRGTQTLKVDLVYDKAEYFTSIS